MQWRKQERKSVSLQNKKGKIIKGSRDFDLKERAIQSTRDENDKLDQYFHP